MAVQRNGNGWKATIKFLGENYYIGTFKTKEEAQEKYNEIKKARERIKSEISADEEYHLRNNDFAVSAYERGQEIKHVCIDCKSGSMQDVRQCDFSDCENFKLRPV